MTEVLAGPSFSPDASAKLEKMARVREGNHGTAMELLARSVPFPSDTATFYHLTRTLGLRGIGGVWIRKTRLGQHTSAFLIGHGNHVVEVVSFRGLRQIRKRWQHTLDGKWPQIHERHKAIYKQTPVRGTNGGLLNRNSGPKDRWAR